MTSTAGPAPRVRWSRVAAGFYVASADDEFLGYIDRDDDGVFFAHDRQGALLGGSRTLPAAMDLVRAQLTAVPHTTGSSDMVSVSYTSLATTRFDANSLSELLEDSRAANARRNVTGVLLYRGGRFFQVLEGQRRVIDALLEALHADPRHHGVRVLIEEAITERRFADWSMAYRPWHASSEDLPDGFRDTFADLDELSSTWQAERTARELLAWFHYRPLEADTR